MSIPVPPACEAGALPFELNPRVKVAQEHCEQEGPHLESGPWMAIADSRPFHTFHPFWGVLRTWAPSRCSPGDQSPERENEQFFTVAGCFRPSLMCLKFVGDPTTFTAFSTFRRHFLKIEYDNKNTQPAGFEPTLPEGN